MNSEITQNNAVPELKTAVLLSKKKKGVMFVRETRSRLRLRYAKISKKVTDLIPIDDLSNRPAFIGIFIFTMWLFLRPSEMYPPLEAVPVAKIAALIAPFLYLYSQIQKGRKLIPWTIEVGCLMFIVGIAIVLMPFAQWPGGTSELLTDTYLKVVYIYIVMLGVVNSLNRLQTLITLIIVCLTNTSIFGIRSYMAGKFTVGGTRIGGIVQGMFGNPNDLAAIVVMFIPLTICCVLLAKKTISRLFFISCGLILLICTFVTFSRSGFLGLAITSPLMVWKYGHGKRFKSIFLSVLAGICILIFAPSGYSKRLYTIFDNAADTTGSAQERREVLRVGVGLIKANPLAGVGMGNYQLYSPHGLVAHNAYVHITAELGIFGLLAYLLLIFTSLWRLMVIEKETKLIDSDRANTIRHLSIALQCSTVAYLICSFFGSLQYYWNIYYISAFSVILTNILEAEKLVAPARKPSPSENPTATMLQKIPVEKRKKPGPRGVIWKPHHLRR